MKFTYGYFPLHLWVYKFDLNVDAIEWAKHQPRNNLGFPSGVLYQLIFPQCQGYNHFHLIHGKVLSNAVSKGGKQNHVG